MSRSPAAGVATGASGAACAPACAVACRDGGTRRGGRPSRSSGRAVRGRAGGLAVAGAGSSRSSSRSSTRSFARSSTSDSRSVRTMSIALSTRSRTIPSTSRPTYPTSVNFDASTLTNGAPASFANRRAISVLPTPVGPIRMMLLGEISSRIASGARWRRHRLRSAIATDFLRFALSDDVAIELRHDLAWRQIGELRRAPAGCASRT